MKILHINRQVLFSIPWMHIAIISVIALLWFVLPGIIKYVEPTAALLDMGILQLMLLGLVCHLTLIALTWWLLKYFWQATNLPTFQLMVSQFKTLTTWQQLGFYWASFALLLLAGVACLAAIF